MATFMRLPDLIAGLEILHKYYDDPDDDHLDPARWGLWCDPTDRPLDAADVIRMRVLGWKQDAPDYSVKMGWKAVYREMK
jgi:hypothetical protein